MTITIKEYLNEGGDSPFAIWFNDLDAIAAAKIGKALYRLEQGVDSENGI